MVHPKLEDAVVAAMRSLKEQDADNPGEQGLDERVDTKRLEEILAEWGRFPREVAHRVIYAYGLPNEATSTRLIWHRTGPFKRTIVYRDEVPHHFPRPHPDVLEQVVDLEVPLDRMDDLVAFDGSLVVSRTRGELAARCDRQEMNVLALNLAHELITGTLSVDEARKKYTDLATDFMLGRPVEYVKRLLFRPRPGGHPDRHADEETIRRLVEYAKAHPE